MGADHRHSRDALVNARSFQKQELSLGQDLNKLFLKMPETLAGE